MKLLQQRMDPVNMLVRRVEADWELKVTQDTAYITQCDMDRWRTGCASIFDESRTFFAHSRRITWNAFGRILFSNTFELSPKTTTFSSRNPYVPGMQYGFRPADSFSSR